MQEGAFGSCWLTLSTRASPSSLAHGCIRDLFDLRITDAFGAFFFFFFNNQYLFSGVMYESGQEVNCCARIIDHTYFHFLLTQVMNRALGFKAFYSRCTGQAGILLQQLLIV